MTNITNTVRRSAVVLASIAAAEICSAGEASFDFNDALVPAGTQVGGNANVTANGGVGDSGLLRLNDALNGQLGTFSIADMDGGTPVDSLEVSFDVRIGGSTCCTSGADRRPADGFSFSFGEDIEFGVFPPGSVAEEGTGNGIIVSFDTWDTSAADSDPAIEVKFGGTVVAVQAMAEPSPSGPRPGPLITDPATGLDMTLYTDMEFAPVLFRLNPDNTFDLEYKNVLIFDKVSVPAYTPQIGGNFIFAGRTGGANESHHIDNLNISTNIGPNLRKGLVNYWSFDGDLSDSAHTLSGSASTVADQGSFAGVNGTGGIAFGPGLFGASGIEQNGAGGAQQNDGYVLVPRSADTLAGATSTITTSLWVQTAGIDTGWQTILAHGEGAQYRIARRGLSNPPITSYAGGSGDIPANDTTGTPIGIDNGWHHVLAISEGGVSTRLWVDGDLVATGGAPNINDNGSNNPPSPDLFIGANPQTGLQNREWWGEIDDVAQWNRALSEEEIAQIYGGGLRGVGLEDLNNPDLLVDFNSTNQDGPANNEPGYSPYDAAHENPGSFGTRNYEVLLPYSGFTTVSVTPAWPNTTDARVQQAIDRTAGFDVNWMGDKLALLTDFLGTDTRTENGGNGNFDGGLAGTPTWLTLTLGGLPAGKYHWRSYHHDTEHMNSFFTIELSTDGGTTFTEVHSGRMTDSTPGGNPDSLNPIDGLLDPDPANLPSTANFIFYPDGGEVVLRFTPLAQIAVHQQFFGINGFELNQLSVTEVTTDSDGDGLSDADEFHVHGTDPNLADTDGDGCYNDGDEIANGTDPFDPNDPAPVVDGGVLFLDGVGDFVTFDNLGGFIPTGNEAFTIEAWINPTSIPAGGGNGGQITFWGTQGPNNTVNGFRLRGEGGVRHYFWGNDHDENFGSSIVPNDTGPNGDGWHHLAITFDGSTAGGSNLTQWYWNGAPLGPPRDAGPNVNVADANFRIGSRLGAEFFHGFIDELRIWEIPRTAQEIQENFERAVDPGSAGLVAYWDFADGATDLTGNGHDGFLEDGAIADTCFNAPVGPPPNPVTFNLAYAGANGATATGFITLDAAIVPNPGDVENGSAAQLGVVDFELTVAGAVSGNGTFTEDDISQWIWFPGTSAVDLGRELIDQINDFNLGTGGQSPGAPVGVNFNTIQTDDGTGTVLTLVSMSPIPRLEVTGAPDGRLTLTWTSKPGHFYHVRSETDPSTALPLAWPIFDNLTNLGATPPENTLTIPLPADSTRLFVIEETAERKDP